MPNTYDAYQGKQEEVQKWMRESYQDADANYDACDLAADACSIFGLFNLDNPDESIPGPILDYALKLLPDEG